MRERQYQNERHETNNAANKDKRKEKVEPGYTLLETGHVMTPCRLCDSRERTRHADDKA